MALAMAKNRFPKGVMYCSKATHYSVGRAARLLTIPFETISTLPNGEIDYAAFAKLASSNEFSRTPIINLNFGTTFTNAIDKVSNIVSIIEDNGISDYYIHYDGSLTGGMRPFMSSTIVQQEAVPEFSFDLPISSLTVSGHKWFGSQVCGVFLSRKEVACAENVEYTDLTSTSGSRNALAILDLWDRVINVSRSARESQVTECIDKACYFTAKLQQGGYPKVSRQLNTVVLVRPQPEIVHRRQLATLGYMAHYVVMPNHGYMDLDDLAAELIDSNQQAQETAQAISSDQFIDRRNFSRFP